MTYPVILNGDHAEFERDHANTPPHERPDWPLPSFDARDWAAAFCKIAKTHGHDLDEEWMVTWFANALMRGYDHRCAQEPQELLDIKRRVGGWQSTALAMRDTAIGWDRDGKNRYDEIENLYMDAALLGKFAD